MFNVNVSISYDHPTRGFLFYKTGEVADLSDWPDLDKLIAEGTVTSRVEDHPADTPAKPSRKSAPAADVPQEGS